jgi:hypothetical protein
MTAAVTATPPHNRPTQPAATPRLTGPWPTDRRLARTNKEEVPGSSPGRPTRYMAPRRCGKACSAMSPATAISWYPMAGPDEAEMGGARAGEAGGSRCPAHRPSRGRVSASARVIDGAAPSLHLQVWALNDDNEFYCEDLEL